METQLNPFESPVDAVVVETPQKCPECGKPMEPGFIRTYFLPWDDGMRPWWKKIFYRFEPLLRMPFITFAPPKIPCHRCQNCSMLVMDYHKFKR